jgi:DNA-binding IclR family transcriptional regulator
VPLHCVASGKVLLAALAEREVLRIVRRGLLSYTERTITELEPLLEELARIRRRGYATALGEFELGLNAVAAPVHDARGNVIAAVDIWGPAFRLTPRRIPELAAQAREAAASISVRLGGTGSATAAQPSLAQALTNASLAASEPASLPPVASGSDGVADASPGEVAAAS